MSTPIFYIRVLEKRGDVLRLRISVVNDGGFDVHDKRDVIKAIGYGGDFIFPDGRIDYGWEAQSRIAQELDFDSELWNDEWLAANAHRYYREARLLSEVNHPAHEPLSPEAAAVRTILTHADAERLFACETYPHCEVQITVTDQAYVAHLAPGMVYSFY
jgi:hypothetical protein